MVKERSNERVSGGDGGGGGVEGGAIQREGGGGDGEGGGGGDGGEPRCRPAGKTKSLQGGLSAGRSCENVHLFMSWTGDVRYGGLGACGIGLRLRLAPGALERSGTQRLSVRLLCLA